MIYVGKARNLRNRVTTYVVGRGARDAKTMTLVHEIDSIDFVTTNNELEAILLENNLIKAHQPRYNILLRDDKSYPYLKVTMSEDYPRVVFTRRIDRRKGDLFFGPFFAGTARRILKLVADQFKLRSCDLDITEGKNALTRPCLYYDMHQCLGPCVVGLTTTEAYREMVDDVVLFLGGKSQRAAGPADASGCTRPPRGRASSWRTYYRDLIRTVERIQAEQQVASAAEDEDVDVWGLYEEGTRRRRAALRHPRRQRRRPPRAVLGEGRRTTSRPTSSARSCSATTRTTSSSRRTCSSRSRSRTRSC